MRGRVGRSQCFGVCFFESGRPNHPLTGVILVVVMRLWLAVMVSTSGMLPRTMMLLRLLFETSC